MPYKTLKNKIDMWKIVTFTLNEKKTIIVLLEPIEVM